MAALLVAMGVMAIVMSTTLPVFSTMARREREAELVFRGQQYARAVSLFQRKYGNALPPNLDVLLNERFLRKQYKDPITGEDFQLVGPGSPELAEAINSVPGQQQPGRGGPQIVRQQQQQQQQQQRQQQQTSGRGMQSNPLTAGTAPGGVLGVVSKSKDTSLRLYNNRDKYNEWVFIATQMSVAAGGGQGGTQMPGARGGAALGAERGGRRGEPTPDSRGRFGQPPPGGPRGGFGGPGMGPQGQPSRGRF
jgi:type II secretory pathway pseudopilin PulG